MNIRSAFWVLAILGTSPLCHAETFVYIAFNEPLPHTITYANRIVDSVECNAPMAGDSGVNAESQQAILNKLTQHFVDAGLDDVSFTASPLLQPDISVFVDTRTTIAPDGFLLDECTGLSLDRFNRRTGEEVVVNLNVIQSGIAEGDTDVDLAAQVIAHEVGHALGLRHAFSAEDNGSTPRGIMRPGGFDGDLGTCQQNCRFLDKVSPISEKPGLIQSLLGFTVDSVESIQRTNAVYHLRRYTGGESRFEVEGTGVCPGSWDVSSFEAQQRAFAFSASRDSTGDSDSTTYRLGRSIDVLYDVDVFEWYGNDIPRRLAQFPQTTVQDLLNREWSLPETSQFEILAAPAPGAVRDIGLARVEPDGGYLFGAPIPAGGERYSLVRVVGPDTVTVLADIVAEVDPVLFADDFEGITEARSAEKSLSLLQTSGSRIPEELCLSGVYTAPAVWEGVQIARRSDGAECGWRTRQEGTVTLTLTSEFPRFEIDVTGGGIVDPALDSDPDDDFNCVSEFSSQHNSTLFVAINGEDYSEDPEFYPSSTNTVRGSLQADGTITATYTSEGENFDGSGRFSLTTGEVVLRKQP